MSERKHAAAGSAIADHAKIEWEMSIPLITNRRVLGDMAIAFGLGAAIGFGLVAMAVVAQGEAPSLLPLAAGFAGAAAGLYVLGLVIMLMVFGNGMHMRFRVDAAGAAALTLDHRARGANRLAAVLGAVARKPGLAGAGLIAASGETVSTGWRAVQDARFDPRRRIVALRNRWRTILVLYCTPENYDGVAATIRAHLAAARSAGRPPRRHPIPPLLGWTVAVIAASFPAYVLPYPLTLDLLVPMIMVAFALATVWLVPLFGYVVMVCAAYLVLEVVLAGMATHRNQFSGRIYSGFDTLDAGEWVAVGLFAAGLAFLVWFSLRAIRGRIPSALTADMAEMDERA